MKIRNILFCSKRFWINHRLRYLTDFHYFQITVQFLHLWKMHGQNKIEISTGCPTSLDSVIWGSMSVMTTSENLRFFNNKEK